MIVLLLMMMVVVVVVEVLAASLFVWNYTERRAETPTLCTFYNSDFLIYSSMGSFYIPCVIMICLYSRIFIAIRAHARKATTTGAARKRAITTATTAAKEVEANDKSHAPPPTAAQNKPETVSKPRNRNTVVVVDMVGAATAPNDVVAGLAAATEDEAGGKVAEHQTDVDAGSSSRSAGALEQAVWTRRDGDDGLLSPPTIVVEPQTTPAGSQRGSEVGIRPASPARSLVSRLKLPGRLQSVD